MPHRVRDTKLNASIWMDQPVMSAPASSAATKNQRENFVIYVVATLTIKPETRAELIAAAKTVIGITRNEKGCILYDLHESTTDPARFVFVEQWESMEDLMAHGGNDH